MVELVGRRSVNMVVLSEITQMPSLHDLITAVRDAGRNEPDAMITLTHHSDDSKWAQLLPDKINLSYPFGKSPSDLIAELNFPHNEKAVAGFWDAELFADFDTSSMTVDQLVQFLDQYLDAAFGTASLDDFAVSFDVAERGTIKAESKSEFLRKIVQLKRYFEGRPTRN
jgi:hypothetical protein